MNKKEQIDYFKKAYLPHIRTTVYFMDISKLRGIEIGNAGGYCVVFNDTFQETGKTEICIFLRDIKENSKNIKYMPHASHEIMHAIQIMCKNLNMKVEDEMEHTAYIMFYLLETLIE